MYQKLIYFVSPQKKSHPFWQWLKQKVYGSKSFIRMEDLIEQLRKLIWHYHEGNTILKINFNYEAYARLL